MILASIPGVSEFITGVGSTAGVAGVFIWTLLKRVEKLENQLEAKDEKLGDLSEKAIEAIVLNKNFLEAHEAELGAIAQAIKDEAAKVERKMESLKNAITEETD